ncbi:MAG: family N-acetyltransferase [Moraxellaceae bacterium]|nr:family N-acetyltransferase [Moraxellaceae bacterium]
MSSAYAVRAALPSDDAFILRLVGAPQPSTGLTLGFERQPSYFQSAGVSHQSPDILVATHRDHQGLAAVVNMGRRPVYVNGERQDIRFGSDMRVSPEHQGGRLLLYFNRAMRDLLGDNEWYQTVILRENARSRATFDQGGRAGIPIYFPQQQVVTYTLTASRLPSVNSAFNVREATAADVPAMNAFMTKMAAHYQFLPAYDFNGVLTGEPYFRGLAIGDFVLVEKNGELRALGALWRQKEFKQTRVLAYQPVIAWLRPFYNLWTRFQGGLQLPPPGGLLDYVMAHSPLAAPMDAEAYTALMQALWLRLRATGGRALCLSLAENDPRRTALHQGFRFHAITGMHYLATYNAGCLPDLDAARVAYFECGRL